MNVWRAAAGWLPLIIAGAVSWAAGPTPASRGESIYLRGVLGSGAPIEATRGASLRSQGAEVACVTCHRRSGLGVSSALGPKSSVIIPPITGQYLFRERHQKFDAAPLPYVENARANRAGYSIATFARAMRQGIDPDGKLLSYLMPRFELSDADLASLIAYLKSLDRSHIPGVTDKVLHFATIITSDADPVKRRGMLDVMERFFAEKNTFPFPPSPPMRSSGHTLYSKSMYMAQRRWELHVWQLNGPAATWGQQLDHFFSEQPVMATVSGLGGSNWEPVHAFCQRARVPCLFPNVDVPVVADKDFYTLYFSRGVLLEADLIAERLRAAADTRATTEARPPESVVQIYRAGDSGEAAALHLAAILKKQGKSVRSQVLPAGHAGEHVADALHGTTAADTLVLWLRPADIAGLGDVPAASGEVYLSGLMGGEEHTPLPASWRSRTRITYPFDLPDRSRVRVNFPLEWFSIKHIPVVAEQVQLDTYLACGVLAESVGHMADVFIPEYLVERVEGMLEHRVMTGPYPRLALSEGERFASKGGYIVHFADAVGTKLMADRDWTVPE